MVKTDRTQTVTPVTWQTEGSCIDTVRLCIHVVRFDSVSFAFASWKTLHNFFHIALFHGNKQRTAFFFWSLHRLRLMMIGSCLWLTVSHIIHFTSKNPITFSLFLNGLASVSGIKSLSTVFSFFLFFLQIECLNKKQLWQMAWPDQTDLWDSHRIHLMSKLFLTVWPFLKNK